MSSDGAQGTGACSGETWVRPCVGRWGALLLACFSLVLPLYLTRGLRRVSSGLGASSAEAVAVGDWSLLLLILSSLSIQCGVYILRLQAEREPVSLSPKEKEQSASTVFFRGESLQGAVSTFFLVPDHIYPSFSAPFWTQR